MVWHDAISFLFVPFFFVEGILGMNTQGKKRKQKKKAPQPVAAKRFKPNNPTKPAAPQRPALPHEDQSKLFLEVLLGDLSKDEFLESYWQKQPFFTSSVLTKLETLLGSTLDIPALQPLFDKQLLYLKNVDKTLQINSHTIQGCLNH